MGLCVNMRFIVSLKIERKGRQDGTVRRFENRCAFDEVSEDFIFPLPLLSSYFPLYYPLLE